jgi:hypothetical protein
MIQDAVIKAFHAEVERSKMPGYVSTYDDFDEDLVAQPHHSARRSGQHHETKVEPAEAGPRAPHVNTAPSKSNQSSAPIRKVSMDKTAKQGGNFGAGIL